ncbi:MAG: hypothetical protein QOG94_549 [Solirubrobacteraceae bacterium]|jgi:hypothetical protein|nr:hypothetical protein [Solirubrobacteraceae bacterium]MEA2138160.1 hypothetical protein [Solirubrobacteraceae bacterium]
MHPRSDSAGSDDHRPRRRSLALGDRAPRTRSVLLATGLLVVGLAPFGIAATGDSLREGRRNGTTVKETEIVSNVRSSSGLKGGYSTRQSNLSDSGGGAIYGCRSQAGGSRATPAPQNPCIRSNNLSKGLAFEFNAANGDVVGAITAGTGGDAKKPFTTNATGIATGLNADRVDDLDVVQILAQARAKAGLDADTVDGLDATDLRPSFAQVSATGTAAQSRGLVGSVAHLVATGLYGVTFAGDLSKCALSATLVDGLGQIAALPAVVAGNTAVAVRTGDSAGAPADHAFHLSVNC